MCRIFSLTDTNAVRKGIWYRGPICDSIKLWMNLTEAKRKRWRQLGCRFLGERVRCSRGSDSGSGICFLCSNSPNSQLALAYLLSINYNGSEPKLSLYKPNLVQNSLGCSAFGSMKEGSAGDFLMYTREGPKGVLGDILKFL